MRRARYLCDVSDVCDLVNVYTGQGRNKVILLVGEENNNSQILLQSLQSPTLRSFGSPAT